MKLMKVIAVLMFTLFLAIACGGSGDSGGGAGGDVAGSAGGDYSYNPGTSTLSITISSSDFVGDCGPEPGTEEFTVTELTETTMIWLGSDTEELTWTRNSGNAGDPVGTWTISESGVDLQLVIDGDGGFSLSGTCDDSGAGGGGGGGSNPVLLIGTWDLNEVQGGPDAGSVPAGTVTVVLTDTTFTVTEPGCLMSGTYTATSTTLTTTSTSVTDTTGDGSGDCGAQGEVSLMAYTVNSTTFTLTEGDGETMIFSKQ